MQKIKGSRGNWDQNDPTADDYIKNRPFYEDESGIHKIDEKYLPDLSYAANKTDVANQDAVVLAEAQAYAEEKVNTLAGNVYNKEQTYTQDEVDALIEQTHQWGEF